MRRAGFRRCRDHWHWVGGPVPPGSDAITLGSVVILRRGREADDRLVAHEHVHVRQWRDLGVPRFLLRYLGSYFAWRLRLHGHRSAYRHIPLEIEAEWQSRRAIL